MSGRREYKVVWQREQRREFRRVHGYSTAAHYGTGGQREAILRRDGRACVRCGMTEAEHMEKWNRPITIDHISRDRTDNSHENLQTLCLSCHGKKDQLPRLRERTGALRLPEMQRMRATGKTYQQIADSLGLSIGTVWTYLNRSSA